MTRAYSHKSPSDHDLREIFAGLYIPEPMSGCWLWVGSTLNRRGGYGCFTCRPAGIYAARAHRVAWEIYRGPIPKGKYVLHLCDNPPCVNPDHLFLGDQPSNMADKVSKGRQDKGDSHGRHKLTEAEALAILNSDDPRPHLAERFGVSLPTIYDIKDGRSWKHLRAFARL